MNKFRSLKENGEYCLLERQVWISCEIRDNQPRSDEIRSWSLREPRVLVSLRVLSLLFLL
jgi:hypothetical protein